MLKLHSTQFAFALLFGPMGLAYISMASAVMLTLLTIVLYFTLLGPAAVVAMWPIAIGIGALAVHLHNSQLRNLGMNLLRSHAGPRFAGMGATLASGARAAAVLALVAGAVFATYRFGPAAADKAADTVASLADKSGIKGLLEARATEPSASARSAESQPVARELVAAPGGDSAASTPAPAAVSTRQSRAFVELPAVAVKNKEPLAKPAPRKVSQVPVTRMADRDRIVKQAIANLRSGPGTEHGIVDVARKGDRLVQFERQGNWVHVRLDGSDRSAWIFGGLLER